ncbi:MAG TPA: oligosaccharide flippase family protein [Planctomycetaceae bacterium]|nr:oligosaccharide flippase family protein [Planctomycetaceae bacterium]
MKPLRDLLKHSSIYAIGQILTRLVSVLLLPLYTHCLSTADYGVVAILDTTAAILSLMIGGGMVTAVTRFHFERPTEKDHDRTWWTGLTWVTVAGTVVLTPMWLGRQMLVDVTLPHSVTNGEWLVTLVLATILVQLIGQLVDGYLRVLKWSGMFVMISMGRLLLNVTLNVWFLVGLKLGVEGLLLGNLIAASVHTLVLLSVFVCTRGPYQFGYSLAKQLLRFSAPLMVTAFLAMLMHDANRYILVHLVSDSDLGVYAFAHKIGFAVNTLCLLPFTSIWQVAIYEINRQKDSDKVFAHIFGCFFSGLGILLLGAALTVHPILPLLTPDAFGPAVELIAVILLALFVLGLQVQFEVPALLASRTGLLVPGSIIGVMINLSCNWFLVPYFGLWGAAWSSVATYIGYSFTTLFLCRNLRSIPYPWRRSLATAIGLVTSYVLVRFYMFPSLGHFGQLVASFVCCSVWSILLLGKDGLHWWQTRHKESAPHVSQEHRVADMKASTSGGFRALAKSLVQLCCTTVMLPCVALYRLNAMLFGRSAFSGWSQMLSLIPGLPGVHLRNAFFRFAMRKCSVECHVGFGTIFSDSNVSIDAGVYIGNYCSIGEVTIEKDVLIASHVSIMNGCHQHGTSRLDIPIREQPGHNEPVTIGRDSWLGERAIVAASVGKHCIIGAGSLVLHPVPDYCVAVGVPAKILRDRRSESRSHDSANYILDRVDTVMAELQEISNSYTARGLE